MHAHSSSLNLHAAREPFDCKFAQGPLKRPLFIRKAAASAMATNGTPAPSNATIAVRLTTRSGRYSIPDSKYVVPADWRRYQLSELINKVLENGEPAPAALGRPAAPFARSQTCSF